MGYAVVHLEKAKGTDSGMSAHIERTIAPKNADAERTHLNRELVEFPDGVENRTQAIQHRLDTAGLTRKIGTNQVRAIRVLLTGTHEDMAKIEKNGQLDNWCNDNLDWLRQTYGADNLVSAVLHLDEKTPHIHATIIPIVTTERKRRKREESVAKKYKKKAIKPRLCTDEVMSRLKLKEYQNTYAEAMQKYGLERGIEGSTAKHISTSKYYRDLIEQSENIQQDITSLLELKEQEQTELSKIRADQSKEKLKNSAANVGSKLLDGASSLLGTPKVKRLEAENTQLKSDIADVRTEIEQVKDESQQGIDSYKKDVIAEYNNRIGEFNRKEQALEKEKTYLEDLIKKIFKMFPRVAEILRMESLCKAIGFATDQIAKLLKMERVSFSGVLTNPETLHRYRTSNTIAHISTDKSDGKMSLNINDQEQSQWFKEQQHRRMYPHLYRDGRSRGLKI